MEDNYVRYIENLNILKNILDEHEFETKLIKDAEVMPFSTLLSVIGFDHKKSPRIVNFNFIPAPKDVVKKVDLLQMISFIDCEVAPDYKVITEKLVNIVNQRVTIGNYFLDKNRKIMFKYVYVISSDNGINKEEFEETVLLFTFMLQLYSKIIESVAQGNKSLSSAINELP